GERRSHISDQKEIKEIEQICHVRRADQLPLIYRQLLLLFQKLDHDIPPLAGGRRNDRCATLFPVVRAWYLVQASEGFDSISPGRLSEGLPGSSLAEMSPCLSLTCTSVPLSCKTMRGPWDG